MAYRYEFDETLDGELRLARPAYETLQEGFRQLHDEFEHWNTQALEHGATEPPYGEEVKDLQRMIEWGDEKLAHAKAAEINAGRVSSNSYR